jgi:hypothetical protein
MIGAAEARSEAARLVAGREWAAAGVLNLWRLLPERVRGAVHRIDLREALAVDANDAGGGCRRAYRGLEASEKAIDFPRSIVYEQAENRRHIANAVLAMPAG